MRQVFEGEAAARYRGCMSFGCYRYDIKAGQLACRPICERAVEARLLALVTGATRLGEKR